MATLKEFREHGGYERWDRWTAWPLVVLGLLFLVVLILPLAHPLSPTASDALDVANVVIWAAFALDYLTRLYLALDRRRFVRTHVLDLIVVVVPFLRPFRLLRLVAIVVSTSRRAGAQAVRRVTLYVVGLTVVVMSVSAVILYDAEHDVDGSNIQSLGDAIWWSVVTVTTVGYGDAFPVTTTGRLVAGVLMFTGIALLGTITAAVAAWFVRAVEGARDESEADIAVQLASLTAAVEALRTR